MNTATKVDLFSKATVIATSTGTPEVWVTTLTSHFHFYFIPTAAMWDYHAGLVLLTKPSWVKVGICWTTTALSEGNQPTSTLAEGKGIKTSRLAATWGISWQRYITQNQPCSNTTAFSFSITFALEFCDFIKPKRKENAFLLLGEMFWVNSAVGL